VRILTAADNEAMAGQRLWDIFCRVIDNHGDAGVCWRLSADLASRGHTVRLWIDDPAPLGFMAPRGAAGVEVIRWDAAAPAREPGNVVIEAFGCDPPASFIDRMAARLAAPVWINLEYLSAERWVERSHGLPSPQGNGLVKWFFFPGFNERTGGLLREPGLLTARDSFDRGAWLRAQGLAPQDGERVVVLFCYDNPRLPDFIAALGERLTLLLTAPGFAQDQVAAMSLPSTVRAQALPWFDQAGFDRLLWSADLNIVRGEDSILRAVWAGSPFVWHIYPQDDGAHGPKLQAFLDLLRHGASPAGGQALAQFWRRFNGLEPGPIVLPDLQAWAEWSQELRQRLAAQDDLVTRLLAFVAGKS
jgi:uncharacterized repeat protein (TIGR03837 family)